MTFASGPHCEHKWDEQVEQHTLPAFLIGEGGDHMAKWEVILQSLWGKKVRLH